MSQPPHSSHPSPEPPSTSQTLPETQPYPSQSQSQPQSEEADTEAIDDSTTLDPKSSTGIATATTSTMPEARNEPHDQRGGETEEATLQQAEARIAQKKELTLREFLGKMDDYAPIIPDALTSHYLTLAGLPPPPTTPLPLARLLALATQKFIADIAADSYQYARIRSGHTTSNTAAALAAAAAAGTSVAGPGVSAGAAASAAGAAVGGKQPNIGTQRPGFGGGGGAQSTGGAGGGQSGLGRTVLTMEDLGMAVGEYGVNVKRGEFYR